MYDEEEINDRLNQVQQQQEVNHIRWGLNQSKRPVYKDSGISEWGEYQEARIKSTRKHIDSFAKFQNKEKEKQKRYTNLLDIFHENEKYRRYENFPKYCRNKQMNAGAKKINLNLPLPQTFRDSLNNSQDRDSSLPTLKRMPIPINFLRKNNKKQYYNDQKIHHVLIHSDRLLANSTFSQEQIMNRTKMIGRTRRQIKNLDLSKGGQQTRMSFIDKNILNNCITFLK